MVTNLSFFLFNGDFDETEDEEKEGGSGEE